MSRFTRSLTHTHTHTHTHNLSLQVIKRQAAPWWQEGEEDCREGQRRVTTTHWPRTTPANIDTHACRHTHNASVLQYSVHHIVTNEEGCGGDRLVCTNWSTISKTQISFQNYSS